MNPLDTRNANTLWCSVWVETWVRCGLNLAVISPGSRSTPLTMALVRHPDVEVIPVIDERSAGFFALGHARTSKNPVVLVCTSGSAGAHYLPAMIEAAESMVPLIAVTADRPPELRDCAAGQTIDQNRLFGRFATWYHELAVPEARMEQLTYLRQTARQAWDRSHAGPIHLNAPFRDPLPPIADKGTASDLENQLDSEWFCQPEKPKKQPALIRIQQRVTTTRGLIVAGPASPEDPDFYVERICAISRSTGWPILADVLSPIRQNAPSDVTVVSTYDLILRSAAKAQELTPRYVLALESWPTSKVLRNWLEQSQAEMLMVSPQVGSRDALHGKTREITVDATALEIVGEAPADPSYGRRWNEEDEQARQRVDTWMETHDDRLFEGRVSWILGKGIPDGALVCVANSMPVRDLEYFWSASARGLDVAFSRGANGIDGTLSTALGTAHRASRPVYLVTGDLAFLHDSNGLMLAKELHGNLTVVLINNSGGGIFEHLPVAEFEPPFERYFATPQLVDIGGLCAAHGVAHERVNSWEKLTTSLNTEPQGGVRVVEINTDRRKDAATRKRLFREFAK